MTEWFVETLHDHFGQRHEIARVLYRDKTEHQDLIIFESPRFGRVLALDGVVQVTEGDEYVYHEMLTHVPMLAHGSAREILIIGGGDGGILRRVLMHPVERATMVEIDRFVVDLCAEYMPSISSGALADPRTDLVIADGCKFVAETDRRFDVIIVDSTDPVGPGAVLFTQNFYADCRRCLKPGGILVNQNGVPFLQPQELTDTWQRLGAVFADRAFYVAAIPTYVGGLMTLGWATDDPSLRRQPVETIQARFERAELDTRYYTPDIHVAAFALPRFMQALLR